MKRIVCEMCESTDFIKQDGFFICQGCGLKYTLDEAKKMMQEVSGENATVSQTQPANSTIVTSQKTANDKNPLLERAWMSIEDGDFQKVDNLCEQVLNEQPKNTEAYLLKLMAEFKVKTREALGNMSTIFNASSNYDKIVKFGNDDLKKELANYLSSIKYKNAIKLMQDKTISSYQAAIRIFENIIDFKNASQMINTCKKEIENINNAVARDIENKYVNLCREYNSLIAEIPNIIRRDQFKDYQLKYSGNPYIQASNILIDGFCNMIGRNYSHTRDEAELKNLIARFQEIINYKDSRNKVYECQSYLALVEKYNLAWDTYLNDNAWEAKPMFQELGNFKDSPEKLKDCGFFRNLFKRTPNY